MHASDAAVTTPQNVLDMRPDDRRALRASIEASIAGYQCAIHALELQYNALAPANVLPDELLARILSAIPPGMTKLSVRELHNKLGRDGSVPPAWAAASRVCRRWRAVTLGGALVRQIDMAQSTRWTEHLVQRAGGMNLRARIAKSSVPAINRFSTFVGTHMEAIAEMEVMCSSAQEVLLITLFAASGGDGGGDGAPPDYPMPWQNLTHLDLRGARGTFYTLPHPINASRLPSLRHLALYNVVLNNKIPGALLAQLSALELAYDVAHVGALSLGRVLQRLNHASVLVRLVVRMAAQGGQPLDADLDLALLDAVTVPALTHLVVEAPDAFLGHIMRVIQAQQLRTTELRSAVWTDAVRVAGWVADPASAVELSNTGVRAPSYAALAITSSPQLARASWTGDGGGVLLLLASEHPRSGIAAPALHAIFHKSGSRLTSLSVSSTPGHRTAQDWASLLVLLNDLERLALAHDEGRAVLELMATSEGVRWLPRLVKVSLLGMDHYALTGNFFAWLEARAGGAGLVPREVVVTGYDTTADAETGEAEVREVLSAMMREYGSEDKRIVWNWKVLV
jgi:hypothetical protein